MEELKELKWLLIAPALAFPHLIFLLVYSELEMEQFGVALGAMWLGCLACTVAAVLAQRLWSARELALAAMLVKLAHVPTYAIWFVFSVLALFFAGSVISLFIDLMAIFLSGALGLTAVVSNRREGKLTAAQAVVHGILQFVFYADVVSAVLVYRASRKQKKEEVTV